MDYSPEFFILLFIGIVVIATASVVAARPYFNGRHRESANSATSDLIATIGTLTDTTRDMSERLKSVEGDVALYRGQIRNLEDRQHQAERLIVDLGHGVEVLTNQVVRLGEEPDWMMPDYAEQWLKKGNKPKPPPADPIVTIYKNLGEYFNDDELRSICMELGIEYQNLTGETRRSKAQEITIHMKNRQLLSDLVEIGRRERPLLDWPEVD